MGFAVSKLRIARTQSRLRPSSDMNSAIVENGHGERNPIVVNSAEHSAVSPPIWTFASRLSCELTQPLSSEPTFVPPEITIPKPILKSTLSKLPFELRGMIFELVLALGWDGQMPALVRALRSEKQLHAECMSIWFKQKHTYILNKKNNWSFLHMSKEMVATITKVKIMIDENITLHPLLRWTDMAIIKKRSPMSLNDLSETAALATSVTSVTLDCRPITTNLYFWYPQKFFLYFAGFANLTYAAITCPIKPDAPVQEGGVGYGVRDVDGWIDSEWQQVSMSGCVENGNMALGSAAKLERVYADQLNISGTKSPRKFEDRDVWIWIAAEGETLKKIDLPRGLVMKRKEIRIGWLFSHYHQGGFTGRAG